MGVLPMVTADDRREEGVQNSLKSDDVYVKDPLLYYTGEKKNIFYQQSMENKSYGYEVLYLVLRE